MRPVALFRIELLSSSIHVKKQEKMLITRTVGYESLQTLQTLHIVHTHPHTRTPSHTLTHTITRPHAPHTHTHPHTLSHIHTSHQVMIRSEFQARSNADIARSRRARARWMRRDWQCGFHAATGRPYVTHEGPDATENFDRIHDMCINFHDTHQREKLRQKMMEEIGWDSNAVEQGSGVW